MSERGEGGGGEREGDRQTDEPKDTDRQTLRRHRQLNWDKQTTGHADRLKD